MKKALILIFVLLSIVFASAAGYLYLNANQLISHLKPELERMASKAIGAPVNIGSIELGLGLQPTIAIASIDIGANHSDSADNDSPGKHLSVGKVLLSIDLIPLISKELRVTKLSISSPYLSLKKTDQGVYLEGLPSLGSKSSDNQPAVTQQQIPSSDPKQLPLAFALEDFTLSDGSISFNDSTKVDALSKTEITHLNISSRLTVSDKRIDLAESEVNATINQSLPFKLNAAHVSLDPKTLDATLEKIIVEVLKATFSIDGALNLTQLKGKLLLSSDGIDLSELSALTSYVPALKLFPLSGSVKPDLILTLSGPGQYDLNGTAVLKELGTVVNSLVVSELAGAISLSASPQQQTITAKEPLAFKFQGAPMNLAFVAGMRGTSGFIEEIDLSAFSGRVSGKAQTSLSPPQNFSTQIDLASLSIEQLLGALSGRTDPPLSGSIESVALNISGELGEALKRTTEGRISIKVKDALLKQVNIAFEAFKGILSLPFIADRLESTLPPEFQQELSASDTKIRSITTSLQGSQGTFSTNDLLLIGSFFTIRGRGTVSMTGAVDINSTISFNEQFSRLLVERVKQLEPALDRNGELTFPLAISGIAPALSIVPDMNALVKLGAEALVREGAEKLIGKALGGRGGPGAAKEIGKLLGF